MYKIINAENGDTIGLIEQPYYIRYNEKNGCKVKTSKDKAEGIAYNSTAYNLPNGNMPDVDKTVILKEFDGAKMIEQLKANTEFLAVMADIEINTDEM